jgi:DHA1 family tetracycline resistance protein-like MFS transporter
MKRRPAGSPMVFLFVTVFVDMMGYGIIVPLLPFFAAQYAGGALLIGLLGSLYAGTQLLGGPFLGGLSDRVGRRPVLISCLLGASLAYLMLGMAGSLAAIALAVALAGAAAGTVATAQAYVADTTGPKERARGLGIMGAAFGLGLICGPALGGLLSLHSLSAPAFAASALAFSNALFGLLVLPESLPPERRTPTPLRLLNPISRLLALLRIENARALLAAVFLLNLSFAGLITNFPLFSAARFGWGTSENAFLFAFVGLCAVGTQGLLVGKLRPVAGERRLLLGGLGIMAGGLCLVALAPSGGTLYPIVGALAVGTGLAIPSVTALLSLRVSERRQGNLMGGLQALLGLTLILGPPLAGLAFDRAGESAPYWLGGTLAALALAVVLAAPPLEQPSSAPSSSRGH